MKHLIRLHALLVLLLAFASCNLYIDEGDTTEGNNTENGDGFITPKTVTDSISTVTYQFNEGTVVLDERHRPYINLFRADSLNNIIEILFSKATPANLLPTRGNFLVTDMSDIFEDKLCHQVDAVVDAGDAFVVKAHMVKVGDVFKHLKIKSEFYVEGDTAPEETAAKAYFKAAGENRVYRGKAVPVRMAGLTRTSKPEAINASLLHFNVDFFNTAKGIVDGEAKDFFKGKDILSEKNANIYAAKKPIIHGDFDGGVGITYDISLRVVFQYDEDEELIDMHGYLTHTLDMGIIINSAKGVITLPIWGGERVNYKSSNSVKGEWKQSISSDNWWIPAIPINVPIPIPFVGASLYATPNFAVDFFAGVTPDKPVGLYYHYSSNLAEFGFHSKGDEQYSYPHGNAGGTDGGGNGWQLVGPDELTFSAGAQLHLVTQSGISIYKALKAHVDFDISGTVSYNNKLADKYKNMQPIVTSMGTKQSLTYATDSYIGLDFGMGFTIGGTLDFKVWSVDLFNMSLGDPVSLVSWTKPMYPEFDATIMMNKSTTATSAYTATVRLSNRNYLFNPKMIPRLAIFSSSHPDSWAKHTMYFVKTVMPNERGDFDPNTTYTYNFDLPVSGNVGKTFIAVPYYLAGFAVSSYYHSLGVPFRLGGTWGKIKNMEQMRVLNGKTGKSQIYAIKLNVNANGGTDVGDFKLRIDVDEYKDDGSLKSAGSKTFSLGQLDAARSPQYIFFFAGRADKLYNVQAMLYTQSADGSDSGDWLDTESIDVQPAGGKETIDYNDVNQSYEKYYQENYVILE